jgi:hypothetical protein
MLALGAMLKGQLLFVVPFFLIWPLWQKRWMNTLRALAGFTAWRLFVSRRKVSPFFEIALVFVRFNHVAIVIVNANHSKV